MEALSMIRKVAGFPDKTMRTISRALSRGHGVWVPACKRVFDALWAGTTHRVFQVKSAQRMAVLLRQAGS